MDFGKFEVKHFDELDSTTWKLIRNYCYSNGYWIDHNFGLGRTRTTVILKAVKADWNNKWTLEQIEWVEERYDPLSRTTRKRKQELTGTPNLPSNLEPNTANSRGLSLEPQTQQFQDIKFETPPQQPFMLQDYRNLSDPWLQQYNQRLLYEQQHPAYRHQSTYGYQPTHGSQYAYELQHAYENQYRPNDYQLVPTPVPNFRSTSMKPHFDDSTSTDNHQPVPNGSISEIRDDCERVPERLTAPNDTSTADTSTLDTSTSNRSIPDTGTPKTNPYIATVSTTNPVSTTSTAKYISFPSTAILIQSQSVSDTTKQNSKELIMLETIQRGVDPAYHGIIHLREIIIQACRGHPALAAGLTNPLVDTSGLVNNLHTSIVNYEAV